MVNFADQYAWYESAINKNISLPFTVLAFGRRIWNVAVLGENGQGKHLKEKQVTYYSPFSTFLNECALHNLVVSQD